MKFSRLPIILSYCLIVLLSFVLLPPAPAYAWIDDPFGVEYDAARKQGQVNHGAYVDKTQKAAMASVACQILPIGPSSEGAQDGLCSNDPALVQEMYNKSVIGSLNGSLAMMYTNPPASTYAFLQDMSYTLGFGTKPVYAQGVGFSGLSALLPIWKAFRNIAYLLLAIVMIVIGFMVMFRKKIDPKTVVTVQNALPRIVVTLLLITFSYAIVGLMIDVMYLAYALIVGLIVSSSNGIFSPETTQTMLTGNWGEAVGLWGRGFRAFDDVLRFFNPGYFSATDPSSINADATSWTTVLALSLQTLVVGLEGVLLFLILSVILLFAVIRLFFMLMSAYIQIIVSLLTAPLQILLEAIPGANTFTSWLKNLTANLIVFPVTAALLMIGEFLARATSNSLSVSGGLWTPPLLVGSGLIGSQVRYGITGVIGLGILLGIPSIVNSIKEALKAKPAISMLGGGGGQGLQTGMQLISTAFYASQMLPKELKDRVLGRSTKQ